jgi:hypothetical protein
LAGSGIGRSPVGVLFGFLLGGLLPGGKDFAAEMLHEGGGVAFSLKGVEVGQIDDSSVDPEVVEENRVHHAGAGKEGRFSLSARTMMFTVPANRSPRAAAS